MKNRKWLIAAGAATFVVLIGAGVVMAQTPAPGSPTGTTFLDRLAQKLGIDTGTLKTAIKGAGSDQIDQAVQNGDLTQKQADNLKNKLNQGTDNGNFGFGGKFRGPGGSGGFGFELKGGPGFGFGLAGAPDQLAQFLGITTDQLKTELGASGATLGSVAQAHGKSNDDLKKFITDSAKTKLDEAVKNGDMTQKNEDNALSMLDQNLDKIINSQFGLRGFHGPKGFRGGMGGDNDGAPGPNGPTPPAPGTSPQPQQGSGSSLSRS